MGYGKKNIFAHFLNDDLLRFSGVSSFVPESSVFNLLSELLIFSLLITREYVLIPGGFADSSSTYNLIRKWQPLFAMGILRLPMREISVDKYLEKKLREWEGLSGSTYDMLEDSRINELSIFLNEALVGRIHREIKMGDSLARKWEAAPDESKIWRNQIEKAGVKVNEIEMLRKTATRLREDGVAVLEDNIKRLLNKNGPTLQRIAASLLYHDYTKIYSETFNAELLYGISIFGHCEFHSSLALYDHRILRKIFNSMGIFQILMNLEPQNILSLRNTFIFEEFIDTLFVMEEKANGKDEFWKLLSFGISRSEQVRNIRRYEATKYNLINDPVGTIENVLADVYESIQSIYGDMFPNKIFKTGRGSMNQKQKVFVVHGHDNEMKQTVARFLEKMGLEAIILHERASGGLTIVEKIERYSDIEYAVVLLSSDDIGGIDSSSLTPRARQNVVFELGYFVGKLGRANVAVINQPDVEIPSDFNGVVYVKYDENWKNELARELKHANLIIDVNALLG